MNRIDKVIVVIFSVLVFASLAATAWFFLVKKQYNFIIEAECDPSVQTCFQRSCDNDGCPVNGLSVYRQFSINAGDFAACANDSCASACIAGSSACTEIMCGDDPADTCTTGGDSSSGNSGSATTTGTE